MNRHGSTAPKDFVAISVGVAKTSQIHAMTWNSSLSEHYLSKQLLNQEMIDFTRVKAERYSSG